MFTLHAVCSSSEWRCGDGSCIPITGRCNGRYECPDYTDEDNCEGKGILWGGDIVGLIEQLNNM